LSFSRFRNKLLKNSIICKNICENFSRNSFTNEFTIKSKVIADGTEKKKSANIFAIKKAKLQLANTTNLRKKCSNFYKNRKNKCKVMSKEFFGSILGQLSILISNYGYYRYHSGQNLNTLGKLILVPTGADVNGL
jgi:hypothetical protein